MLDEENTTFPVLPLRDIVVFPHMIVPLFVGREKSVKALEEVMKDNKQILLSSQIDPSEDQPTEDSIFRTGVLANVLQLLKLPDGTVKVLVEGQTRVLITKFLKNETFFEATCEEIEETRGDALFLKGDKAAAREAYLRALGAAQELGINNPALQRKADSLAIAGDA